MTTTTANPSLGQITGSVLFYAQPEPLNPEMHGSLGVKQMSNPFGFARVGNAVPLTVGEFQAAAISGPIIFAGPEKMPLHVLGLKVGENMFIDETGTFQPGVYIPAYIRRYPFVYAQDDAARQMVLCIDRAAEFIVEGGEFPFFDEKGQPSDYTKRCLDFCNNFEMERQRTVSFVKILNDLDLFETKTASVTPVNPDGSVGEPQKLTDYFGVSEEKLKSLAPDKLAELRDNGALTQIYAHLVSLGGWDRLITLAVARSAEPAQASS